MIRRALRSLLVRAVFGLDPEPLVAELRGLRRTVLRLHREQLEDAAGRHELEARLARVERARSQMLLDLESIRGNLLFLKTLVDQGIQAEIRILEREVQINSELEEQGVKIALLARAQGTARVARAFGVEPHSQPCKSCRVAAGAPCVSEGDMGYHCCWTRVEDAWKAADAKKAPSTG